MLESSAESKSNPTKPQLGNILKIWTAIFSGVLAIILMLSAHPVEAKRLGGGGSVGRQSSNVTQRQATPPAQRQAVQGAPATTPAPAPAVAPKKPWATLLGGLVVGAGLAWLASSLGLGEILSQILLFGLLALVVMGLIGWVIHKRKGSATNTPVDEPTKSPFAFSGAGSIPNTGASHYSASSVGNDASARPWERSGGTAFEAASAAPTGSMIGSALTGSQSWGVPAGFDADGFLKACKANFIGLQDAWDRSDIQNLRAMMTDDMLTQIKSQLAERETHTSGITNKTEVAMLNAQLLGIEELNDVYMASVEFSGMIKEDALADASPFREVWNMTKPRQGGGGWLVAGVQALQ